MCRRTEERSKIHHISYPSLPSSLASVFHVAKIQLADRYAAWKPDWLHSSMFKIPLGEVLRFKHPIWAISHIIEISLTDYYVSRHLIDWILWCLKTHWAKSSCLKTNSEQFSTLLKSDWLIVMKPWNMIGWMPQGLKSHWAKSPYLKTPPERFSTLLKSDWLIAMEPRNLIGRTARGLKPHWVKCPYLKTPPERFSTLLKSDWLIAMGPPNLIGWIPGGSKPHWVKTPLDEFSIFDNL